MEIHTSNRLTCASGYCSDIRVMCGYAARESVTVPLEVRQISAKKLIDTISLHVQVPSAAAVGIPGVGQFTWDLLANQENRLPMYPDQFGGSLSTVLKGSTSTFNYIGRSCACSGFGCNLPEPHC
jgi:hypothetical protein